MSLRGTLASLFCQGLLAASVIPGAAAAPAGAAPASDPVPLPAGAGPARTEPRAGQLFPDYDMVVDGNDRARRWCAGTRSG
jgi:hypothetical protein